MPAVWFSLKKSLHCKTELSDVHDPGVQRNHLTKIVTKKPSSSSAGGGRSGCSRSIANLKDVIHGSKRHMEEKPPSASPRSIGSSELLNPIAHEVVLSNSTCELKIRGFSSFPDGINGESVSRFEGTLKPGTPGPRPLSRTSTTIYRKSPHHSYSRNRGGLGLGSGFGAINPSKGSRGSFEADSHGISALNCHKCGEQFMKWDAVEAHHLSKHAVTELVEGDSSRKIVELIYKTSWSKSNTNCGGIERILKVHNMQKTLAQFEDYREMVKIKASKLPKKHPRCLADGNELLRFHGTFVECRLGINGSSSLCTLEKCNVCQILRHGFSVVKKRVGKSISDGSNVGVFTTSTSERAFESIELVKSQNSSLALRKALIVCRVIAGRVHRPLENVQELANQSGFDSLAGKVGLYSNIEELYLLNPKALLPCFVIVCKQ